MPLQVGCVGPRQAPGDIDEHRRCRQLSGYARSGLVASCRLPCGQDVPGRLASPRGLGGCRRAACAARSGPSGCGWRASSSRQVVPPRRFLASGGQSLLCGRPERSTPHCARTYGVGEERNSLLLVFEFDPGAGQRGTPRQPCEGERYDGSCGKTNGSSEPGPEPPVCKERAPDA